MQRLGPQAGVDAHAECAQVPRSPVAGHVQPDPPQQASHRAREAAPAQGPAEGADRLDRLFLALLEVFVELAGRVLLRTADLGEEHGLFLSQAALDGHRSDAHRVLVEVRPGERQVGSPQFRPPGGDQGVGLGEQGAPTRARLGLAAGGHQRADAHAPLHRHGRPLLCEMQQVPHPKAGQRQGQAPAVALAHFALATIPDA